MEFTLFYIFAIFAITSAVMVIRAKNPVYAVLFLILTFCNSSGLLVLSGLDFFALIFLVVYVGAIAVLFLFVVMMLHIKLSEINENVLRYLPIGILIGCIFGLQIAVTLENDFIAILPQKPNSSIAISNIIWSFVFLFLTFVKAVISQPLSIITLFKACSDETLVLCQSFMTLSKIELVPLVPSINYIFWPQTMVRHSTIEAIGDVVYTTYVVFFIAASLILLIAMIGAIRLTLHHGVSVKRQDVCVQNARDFQKTITKIRMIGIPSLINSNSK